MGDRTSEEPPGEVSGGPRTPRGRQRAAALSLAIVMLLLDIVLVAGGLAIWTHTRHDGWRVSVPGPSHGGAVVLLTLSGVTGLVLVIVVSVAVLSATRGGSSRSRVRVRRVGDLASVFAFVRVPVLMAASVAVGYAGGASDVGMVAMALIIDLGLGITVALAANSALHASEGN